MEKSMTEFGKRLEKALSEKNMSDSDLSRKLKVQAPQIYALHRTRKPREGTLKKLSKILGKSMEYWEVETSNKKALKSESSPPAILHSASKTSKSGKGGKVEMFIIAVQNGEEISRKEL